MSSLPKQSSGVSGPANAGAGTPRADPISAGSAGGPSRAELRAAWDAYAGAFAGPLEPLAGQPNLNVLANRCGSIVRTGVDFLFGPVLKIQTQAGAAAQAILDATWGDDDKRMTTLSKSRINGGAYGHVFVKIVTPRNKKPMSAENPPRIVVQNPEQYTVETDPDDCELVTRYICTWSAYDAGGNPVLKRQTTTRIDPDDDDDSVAAGEDADTRWEIQNWIKADGTGDDGPGSWEMDGPVMLWPYPFAPIVDWQNYPNPNDHWGARDVDDSVVNLNRALHLVESNTASVMYSQGHPWPFIIGADAGGITPTPGTITELPAGASVTQLNAAGDIPAMQGFAAQIRSDMDEASSTPGVATGRMSELPKGAMSGITVRLLYGPRIMRTEHERRLYGQGIRAVCRAALVLCGQETAAEDEVDLVWQDPLPQDDLAMAQMALTLQQLGVSDHSIYALIGLNYDTEQEYKATEAKDAMKAAMQGGALPVVGMPPMTQPGQPPADPNADPTQQQQQQPPNAPPMMHPAAIQARQAAQQAAGKKPTPGGL
jgi:hypothetical protein